MGKLAVDIERRLDIEMAGDATQDSAEAPTGSEEAQADAPGAVPEVHRPVVHSAAVARHHRFRLAIFAGARASVLAEVPREADRFTQMLPLLLATAALSAISMAFAIATGVFRDKPFAWFAAIPIALLWAALIFVVDRALTASMKSTRSRLRIAFAAVPRVLLAALIGAVVSGPLVLQVFAKDINQEMMNVNLEQGTAQHQQLEDGPEKDRLDRARDELTKLRQQAQTGAVDGVESTSETTTAARSRVSTLQGQVDDERARLAQATALYVCERNGAPMVEGCTGVAGTGPAFEAARMAMESAQATFDQLSGQLEDAQDALDSSERTDAANTTSTAQANKDDGAAQLPGAQTEYDAALAAYTALSQSISQTNSEALGLLAQMRALERIQERDPSVAILHWAIAALFFAIELMPVMVKMFRSYGDPNPYELAEEAASAAAAAQSSHERQFQIDRLDHERQLQVDRLTHEREEELHGRRARSTAARAVEQDMLDREIRIGIAQNERVASQMQVVVSEALDQWQRDVRDVFEQRTAQPMPADEQQFDQSPVWVGSR